MVIPLVAALLLGIALTAVGLRGRRTDDHPLCRRCRFDLTGRPATAERRCPECGADLGRPRATVVGHRRRRAGMLAGGVACLTAGVVLAYGQATGMSWYRFAPLAYVLREGSSADAGRRWAALAELQRRTASPRCSAADWAEATRAALAYQRDLSKPWDPAWGGLIENARAAGHLTDGEWHQYAWQAVMAPRRLLAFPQAAPDGVLWRLTVPEARLADPSSLALSGTYSVELLAPQVEASRWRVSSTGGGWAALSYVGTASPRRFATDAKHLVADCFVTGDLPYGRHAIRVTTAQTIFDYTLASPACLVTAVHTSEVPFEWSKTPRLVRRAQGE